MLKTRDFTQLEPDTFEFKYYAPGVGQILADEGLTEQGGEPELSPELVSISELLDATLPALSAATFDENSSEIDHPYLAFTPGSLNVYEGQEFDDDEIDKSTSYVLVTNETKDILGITSRVVEERKFDDGLLDEETKSYYAQDAEGNVWLLGKSETEYEYDATGKVISADNSDSWLAGEGQSLPGFIVEASPQVGDAYYQRFDITEDRDLAQIIATDAAVSTDEGSFNNVLQVRESSNLEPDSFDNEYYAPGVGLVFSEEVDEDGEVEFSSSLDDTYQLAASHTLDFETSASGAKLTDGSAVNSQYDSLSGLAISTPYSNSDALIYDCDRSTGNNCNLASESQGNVLIASESDGNIGGGKIRFDWSDSVFVDRIELLDIDRLGGSIAAYDDDGQLIRSVSIGDFDNNNLGQIELKVHDVAYLDVNLNGSGAIAELSFSELTEV